MTIRTREQCEADLGSKFPAILDAASVAIGHYWEAYRADVHRLRDGTRANMLCDLIGDELRKRFDGMSGVKCFDRYKVLNLEFGTSEPNWKANWMMKAHKVDEDFKSSPNDTQLCLDLNDNNVERLPFPEATVIYVGYKVNPAAPMLPEIMIICPRGAAEPHWVISLGRATPPTAIELPQTPTAPPTDGTKVVVRPEEKKQED